MAKITAIRPTADEIRKQIVEQVRVQRAASLEYQNSLVALSRVAIEDAEKLGVIVAQIVRDVRVSEDLITKLLVELAAIEQSDHNYAAYCESCGVPIDQVPADSQADGYKER